MGDSRNEEAIDSNDFGGNAGRIGWMPIHGMPVARACVPTAKQYPDCHLRQSLFDQSLFDQPL
jgi:hypothetical protein